MKNPRKLTEQPEEVIHRSPAELTTEFSKGKQEPFSTYPKMIKGCPSAVAADAMLSKTIKARKERQADKILIDA